MAKYNKMKKSNGKAIFKQNMKAHARMNQESAMKNYPGGVYATKDVLDDSMNAMAKQMKADSKFKSSKRKY